ncbi:MAG: MFS transporter [Steroidobacteraceae bacterium]
MNARGWSFLLALLLVAANLRPSLTGVGPLLASIQAELGLSATAAGLLGSLPLVLFAIASPFARFARAVGTERLVAIGLLTLIAGTLWRSSGEMFSLYAGTTVLAAGIAVTNILVPMLVKEHFPDRVAGLTTAYATVMGTFAALSSGLSVPISHVAPGGWRGALASPALLALVTLLAWLPQTRAPASAVDSATSATSARIPWHSPLAWSVTAYMGFQSTMFYVGISWFPTYLREFGYSPESAGWLLTLYQAAALVAGTAIPWFVRRLPDQRALAIGCAALGAAAITGLLLAPGAAALWMTLLGVGAGPSLILALSFMALRAADAPMAASLSLMAQAIGYAFAALGPLAFGAVHDHTQGWIPAMSLNLVHAIGKASCGWFAGRSRTIA